MFEFTEMKVEHYDEAYKIWEVSEEIELTLGDSKESFINYLKRNPGMSYVCFDKSSDLIVGTILCGHDGRRGFIYHLTVKKDYRGNSIGKTLLGKSISSLKAIGIERCIIMVKNYNDKGNDFWEKIDWKRRDELIMYSKNL